MNAAVKLHAIKTKFAPFLSSLKIAESIKGWHW